MLRLAAATALACIAVQIPAPALASRPESCKRVEEFFKGNLTDAQAALADANACVQQNTQAPAEAHAMRAYVHLRLARWSACVADIDTVLRDPAGNDQRGVSFVFRGMCNHGAGQPAQAIQDYTASLGSPGSNDSERAQVHFLRGQAHEALNQFAEAANDYRAAIQLEERFLGYHVALAKAESRAGGTQIQQPVGFPQVPTQPLPPQTPPLAPPLPPQVPQQQQTTLPPAGQTAAQLSEQGYAAYKEGNYQQALALLNQALQLDPNFALAYADRGTVHSAMKNYALALADLDTAIRLDGRNAYFFRMRGYVHRLNGSCPLAVNDQTQSLSLQPNNVFALEERGWCYVTLGRNSEAIVDLSQAIAGEPKSVIGFGMRGTAQHNLHNHAAALADYQMALSLDPKWTLIHGNLCGLYFDMKRYPDALQACDTALSLDPGDQWVIDLKQKIQVAMAGNVPVGQVGSIRVLSPTETAVRVPDSR